MDEKRTTTRHRSHKQELDPRTRQLIQLLKETRDNAPATMEEALTIVSGAHLAEVIDTHECPEPDKCPQTIHRKTILMAALTAIAKSNMSTKLKVSAIESPLTAFQVTSQALYDAGTDNPQFFPGACPHTASWIVTGKHG